MALGVLALVGLTVVVTGIVWVVLNRGAVLDVPNERSMHDRPVVRGGGIAVAIGLVVAPLLGVWHPARSGWIVVASALCFGLLGLVDDLRRGLGARLRLSCQLMLAIAGSAGLAAAATASWWSSVLATAAGAFAIAGFVNAFNFMDGMNGVAASTAIVIGVTDAVLGSRHGLPALHGGGVALATCAAGFLPWNFPRARIFLGDVGSYLLGATIASLGVLAWLHGVAFDQVVAPAALFGTDVTATLVGRWRRGAPLFEAHREHVYQRLALLGWPPVVVTMTMVLASAIQASIALGRPSGLLGFTGGIVAMLAVSAAYLALPTLTSRWLSARP